MALEEDIWKRTFSRFRKYTQECLGGEKGVTSATYPLTGKNLLKMMVGKGHERTEQKHDDKTLK